MSVKPSTNYIQIPRSVGKVREVYAQLTMRLLDLKNGESAIIPCQRGYLEAHRIRTMLLKTVGEFFKIEIQAATDFGMWPPDNRRTCVGYYVLATRCEGRA